MQRLLILLLLVLPIGTAMAQKVDEKEEKRLLKKAEEHIMFQEYLQAVHYLRQAEVINPNNKQTHMWLGLSLYELGQQKQALTYLELVAKEDPIFDPRLNYYLARALHHNLRFEEAKNYYLKEIAQYKVKDPEYQIIENEIRQCDNAKKLLADTVPVIIENLGPNVNTKFSDFAPVITADESLLLFTSRRPGNLGGVASDNKPYEDVFISEAQADGSWGAARSMGDPINSGFHDASVSLAADGRTVYIYRDSNNGGLYMSKQRGGMWSTPEAVGKPIRSKYHESSICVSADGRYAIFESDRPGGYGGRDLYWTEMMPDGEWAEPVSLGPLVNTQYDEDGPYLHPDGRTLYFSSKGHTSMGGYDIFKTTWNADKSFTPPTNIGYPINTAGDDIFFVVSASGKHAYLSSVREGGHGDDDIYRITWVQPKPKEEATAINNEDTGEEKLPEFNLTLLKGTVRDAETKQALFATLVIVDNTANDTISIVETNESTGKYLITLPGGRNYGISATAQGYLFTSSNFDIPLKSGYHEEVRDLELQRLKAGQKIVLRNIFYDFDKATLRPESVAELERLMKILEDNPNMRIRLGSHTDSKGTDEYNQMLSESRAKSVVSWLIEHGISTKRLEFKGYGESQPIDTNDTDEGRQNNRRTEFEIISND